MGIFGFWVGLELGPMFLYVLGSLCQKLLNKVFTGRQIVSCCRNLPEGDKQAGARRGDHHGCSCCTQCPTLNDLGVLKMSAERPLVGLFQICVCWGHGLIGARSCVKYDSSSGQVMSPLCSEGKDDVRQLHLPLWPQCSGPSDIA